MKNLGATLMERCEPGTALCVRSLSRMWWSPGYCGGSGAHRCRYTRFSLYREYWGIGATKACRHWSLAGCRSCPGRSQPVSRVHTAPAGGVALAYRSARRQRPYLSARTWLVIDRKPFVGDPAYDATQYLFNCDERRADPERHDKPHGEPFLPWITSEFRCGPSHGQQPSGAMEWNDYRRHVPGRSLNR